VIIGTAAITNPGFLHEACFAFPGQIIVGLDAKDGEIAINGWSKLTGHSVFEMAQKFEDYGVASIIYTDIGRDGMLEGINIDATVKLAESGNVPIIASGGLSNMDDIKNLCAVANVGIRGVIAGRSIYEGTLDFEKACNLAEELTG
jgi:phosphoribosylformimino-5-aminoimidazole carboxamide ribotide isomerase